MLVTLLDYIIAYYVTRKLLILNASFVKTNFCNKKSFSRFIFTEKGVKNLNKQTTSTSWVSKQNESSFPRKSVRSKHTYMHSPCTVYVRSIHSLCTVYAQSMHNLFTVYLQSMHSPCTVYAQSMHSLYTVYTQSIHSLCTVHAQSMHSPYTVYAQSIRSLYTLLILIKILFIILFTCLFNRQDIFSYL